jgi:hypothetical protein
MCTVIYANPEAINQFSAEPSRDKSKQDGDY